MPTLAFGACHSQDDDDRAHDASTSRTTSTTPVRHPALTQDESDAREFECPDAEGTALHTVSVENNGTVTLWNAAREAIEVPSATEAKLISVLLRGHVDARHVDALAQAIEERNGSVDMRLLELYSQLLVYVPPRDFDSLMSRWDSISKAQHIARDPRNLQRTTPRTVRSSLLWTVNLEGQITSAIGDAADDLFEEVHRRRPVASEGPVTLAEYYATDDPTYPPIMAHMAALRGESASYVRTTPDGHEWHARIEPVERNGKIIGAVGYKVDHAVGQRDEPNEEAYCVTNCDGVVLSYSRPFKRMFKVDPTASLSGLPLLRPAVARAVADPSAFMSSTEELLRNTTPASHLLEMADGRMVHRYAHPVMGPDGQVRTWAMYWTEVRRDDRTTTGASGRRHG